MSLGGPSSWPSARPSTTGTKRPNRPCLISSNSWAEIWWTGAIPPNLNLARIQTHKELQWFTDLFDDIEIEVYSGDDPIKSLTHREFTPSGEKATHRLWPSEYTERERMARVVRPVFRREGMGETEPLENSTGPIRLTMTFKLARDEQAGTFRIVSN